MVKIALDPRAAASLNERATELLGSLTRAERQERAPAWKPDVQVTATITEADIIGDMDYGLSTAEGKRISLAFSHEQETYEIGQQNYHKVDQLVTAVLKNRDIKEVAAETTVEDLCRQWIRKRFRGDTTQEFSEYLIVSLRSRITSSRVWVPIDQLHIQQPFRLGHTEVEIISRDFIQRISATASSEAGVKGASEMLGRYQGHAAIVVSVLCEPARARELAIRAAEKTLAALSLLSPAAFNCRLASAASLWGSKRLRSATTMLLQGDKLVHSTEGIIGPPLQSQVLDTNLFRSFESIIRCLHFVLLSEASSPLAAKLIDALQVYHRGVASPDPAEKLIYTFASLEMILLRNANEAVQENIATRIAFVIGQSVDERRAIISIVKDGYSLRSAFVHHGLQVGDTDAANKMLRVAWRTLVELLNAPQRYRDVNELIQALENRKLQ